MASKEVAVKEEAKLPSAGFDVSRFAGKATGLENVQANDLLIPRLTILQSNSPQVTMGQPEYDEKYKPGMIYDTGLAEIMEKPLIFLPVHFNKVWIEWAPRETKKGIITIYESDDIMQQTTEDAMGRAVLPTGNYIVETAQIYGLNVNAKLRPSYFAMTSTQLKKSRRWLTLATTEEIFDANSGTSFQAPFYYRSYALGTVPESNAKGNWIGWTLERYKSLSDFSEQDAQLAERMFEKAESFKKAIDAGETKADLSGMEDGSVSGGGGGGGRRAEADTGQAM
jgi:hypothetical protein